LGIPGAGKSSIGNTLLTGDPLSQLFESKNDPGNEGVTKAFISHKRRFFGD